MNSYINEISLQKNVPGKSMSLIRRGFQTGKFSNSMRILLDYLKSRNFMHF